MFCRSWLGKQWKRFFSWWLGIGMAAFTLVGCLQTSELTNAYERLTIRDLDPNTTLLRIQLFFCSQDNRMPLVREREVRLAIGGEDIYLPALPAGEMDLQVRSFARDVRTGKERLLQQTRLWIQRSKAHEKNKLPQLALSPWNQKELVPCQKAKVDTEPSAPQSQARVDVSPLQPRRSSVETRLPKESEPSSPSPSFTSPLQQDSLIERRAIYTGFPSWGLAAQGHQVIVTNASPSYSADSLTLLDARANIIVREIEVMDDCKPRSVDMQGQVCAVVCAGTDRLFLFHNETWEKLAPKEGVVVGKGAVAVRLSGAYAVVISEGTPQANVYRLKALSEAPKVIPLPAKPTAISASEGEFFLTLQGEPPSKIGRIFRFLMNAQGQVRLISSSPSTGVMPQDIAVNGRYAVVANSGNRRVTVFHRALGTTRQLPLLDVPSGVAILGNTAFVVTSKRSRLYLLDLRTMRFVQILKTPKPASRIAVTGEWLLLSTHTHNHVMRYRLTSRTGLLNVRLASASQQLSVAQGQAWLHDKTTRQLYSFALARAQETLVPGIQQKPLLQKYAIPTTQWLRSSSQLLLHTSEKRTRLHFRRLDAPGQLQGEELTFKLPLRSGRVEGDMAYLSHWDQENNGSVHPFITRINLAPLTQNKPWDAITIPLPFGRQYTKIIDILPWESHLLLLDQTSYNLYLMKRKPKEHQLKHLDTITLPGRPQKMVRLGHHLVILLDDYNPVQQQSSLILLDLQAFANKGHANSPQKRLSFSGRLVDLLPYQKHLLLVDERNNQLLLLSLEERKVKATMRVGCGPAQVALWQKTEKDVFAVVRHNCNENVSLLPLPNPQ